MAVPPFFKFLAKIFSVLWRISVWIARAVAEVGYAALFCLSCLFLWRIPALIGRGLKKGRWSFIGLNLLVSLVDVVVGFLFVFGLLFVWRWPTLFKKVSSVWGEADSDDLMWNEEIRKHIAINFVYGVLDLIAIFLAMFIILAPHRLYSMIKKVRSESGGADRRRVVAMQALHAVCDILCYLPLFFMTLVPWRTYYTWSSLIQCFKKEDGMDSWKPQKIIAKDSLHLLVDVVTLLFAIVLVPLVYRWVFLGAHLRRTKKKKNYTWRQMDGKYTWNGAVIRHALHGVVDILIFIASIPLLLAVYRWPILYLTMKRKRKQSIEKFGEDLVDFDLKYRWNRVVVYQIFHVLVDIPTFIAGLFALLGFWRWGLYPAAVKRLRAELHIDSHYKWNLAVFLQFVHTMLDIPCVIALALMFMTLWRVPAIYSSIQEVRKKQQNKGDPVDQSFSVNVVIVKQLIHWFVDIPTFILFALTWLCVWRIPKLLRRLHFLWVRRAKLDPDRKYLWNIRIVQEFVHGVVDFFTFIILFFVLAGFWRWKKHYALIYKSRETNRQWDSHYIWNRNTVVAFGHLFLDCLCIPAVIAHIVTVVRVWVLLKPKSRTHLFRSTLWILVDVPVALCAGFVVLTLWRAQVLWVSAVAVGRTPDLRKVILYQFMNMLRDSVFLFIGLFFVFNPKRMYNTIRQARSLVDEETWFQDHYWYCAWGQFQLLLLDAVALLVFAVAHIFPWRAVYLWRIFFENDVMLRQRIFLSTTSTVPRLRFYRKRFADTLRTMLSIWFKVTVTADTKQALIEGEGKSYHDGTAPTTAVRTFPDANDKWLSGSAGQAMQELQYDLDSITALVRTEDHQQLPFEWLTELNVVRKKVTSANTFLSEHLGTPDDRCLELGGIPENTILSELHLLENSYRYAQEQLWQLRAVISSPRIDTDHKLKHLKSLESSVSTNTIPFLEGKTEEMFEAVDVVRDERANLIPWVHFSLGFAHRSTMFNLKLALAFIVEGIKDVLSIAGFIVILCTLYRAPLLMKRLIAFKGSRRDTVWDQVVELLLDLLHVAGALVVIALLWDAPALILALSEDLFVHQSAQNARGTVRYYLGRILIAIQKLFSLFTFVRTYKILLGMLVYGVFGPIEVFTELCLAISTIGCLCRTICCHTEDDDMWYGFWGFLMYGAYMFAVVYLPVKVRPFSDLSAIDLSNAVLVALLGLVILIVLVLASKHKALTRVTDLSGTKVKLSSWPNLLVLGMIVLESAQLISIAFSIYNPFPQALQDQAPAGKFSDRFASFVATDYSREFRGIEMYQLYFWVSVGAIALFYLLTSAAVVTSFMQRKNQDDLARIVRNPAWYILVKLLSSGFFVNIVLSLLKVLPCETIGSALVMTADPNTECFSATHNTLSLVAFIALGFYVPTATVTSLSLATRGGGARGGTLQMVLPETYILGIMLAKYGFVLARILWPHRVEFALGICIVMAVLCVLWTAVYKAIFKALPASRPLLFVFQLGGATLVAFSTILTYVAYVSNERINLDSAPRKAVFGYGMIAGWVIIAILTLCIALVMKVRYSKKQNLTEAERFGHALVKLARFERGLHPSWFVQNWTVPSSRILGRSRYFAWKRSVLSVQVALRAKWHRFLYGLLIEDDLPTLCTQAKYAVQVLDSGILYEAFKPGAGLSPRVALYSDELYMCGSAIEYDALVDSLIHLFDAPAPSGGSLIRRVFSKVCFMFCAKRGAKEDPIRSPEFIPHILSAPFKDSECTRDIFTKAGWRFSPRSRGAEETRYVDDLVEVAQVTAPHTASLRVTLTYPDFAKSIKKAHAILSSDSEDDSDSDSDSDSSSGNTGTTTDTSADMPTSIATDASLTDTSDSDDDSDSDSSGSTHATTTDTSTHDTSEDDTTGDESAVDSEDTDSYSDSSYDSGSGSGSGSGSDSDSDSYSDSVR